MLALKGGTLPFPSPWHAPILWSGSPRCRASLQKPGFQYIQWKLPKHTNTNYISEHYQFRRKCKKEKRNIRCICTAKEVCINTFWISLKGLTEWWSSCPAAMTPAASPQQPSLSTSKSRSHLEELGFLFVLFFANYRFLRLWFGCGELRSLYCSRAIL